VPGQRTVLFVSKPIVPPFHDGAKCLVRDVALELRRYRPIVLGTHDAPALADGIEMDRVYRTGGSFAPALRDKARVFQRLLLGRGPDVWHFVFAPNPVSSSAGRVARALRPVATVQTVASAPRSFAGSARLLFGDRVVTTSAWTRDRLVADGAAAARIRVIPPSVPELAPANAEWKREWFGGLDLPEGVPLIVYPGDLEISTGAALFARALPSIFEKNLDVHAVYACRAKTERAAQAQQRLERELAPHARRIRFVGEVPSLPALLSVATVVAFPVDNLFGKVDLPIAVLEAMALGVPVVVLDLGPLRELEGALCVPPGDGEALAGACVALLDSAERRAELAEKGRAAVRERHRPAQAARAYEALYDELLR